MVPRLRSTEPCEDDDDEVTAEPVDHLAIVGRYGCRNPLRNMPPVLGWRDAAGCNRYIGFRGDGNDGNRIGVP